MSECVRCKGKSTVFLCNRCVTNTHELLTGLIRREHKQPGWIDLLIEASVGQARLGELGGRRKRGRRGELDGDKDLAKCIATLPGEEQNTVEPEFIGPLLPEWRRRTPMDDDNPTKPDRFGRVGLAWSRWERARQERRRLLAAGGVNARASEELDALTDMLSTWCRDICEMRGIKWRPLKSVEWDFVGPIPLGWHRLPPVYTAGPIEFARWLRAHLWAISMHPGADEFCDELDQRVKSIERVLNRPVPPKYIGPCPTTKDRQQCLTELTARPEAVEVTCPTCKTTYNVEQLQTELYNAQSHRRYTINELVEVVLPKLNEPVPERTLYDWISKKKLAVAGYRRPDGRQGLARQSRADEVMVRLGDVQRLRAVMNERKRVG